MSGVDAFASSNYKRMQLDIASGECPPSRSNFMQAIMQTGTMHEGPSGQAYGIGSGRNGSPGRLNTFSALRPPIYNYARCDCGVMRKSIT